MFFGCLAVGFLTLAEPALTQKIEFEPLSEGLMRDAQSYSERFGTSVEEALRRLELQEQVGILNEHLEVAEEATFGGLWIEHEPEYQVIALFTEPREGQESISQAPLGKLESLIVVRPARFTLAELNSQLEEVGSQVRRAGARVDLSLNVRQNQVEILTPDPAGFHSILVAKNEALPSATVVVEVESLFHPQQQDLLGGRPVDKQNCVLPFCSPPECTSGFAVRTSQGQLGISTAAHCDDALLDRDSTTPLVFEGEVFGGSRDVQLHTVGCQDTILNRIDDGPGTRAIHGSVRRSAQANGTFVCKHGRTTGRTCGTIDSRSVCPSYIPSCSSTFICVQSSGGEISDGGDSGGPWFVGDRAYGSHSGGDQAGSFAIYMAVDYMNGLGYSVLTQPQGLVPSVQLSCSPGGERFSCVATASGGTPPHTLSNWTYSGPASAWNVNGSTIAGFYSWPGCPTGASNTVTVRVTDDCGRTSTGSVSFACPASSPCRVPPC